ncbi:MAG: rRNA maturation RNase YbeY [Bacteroidales bacterium]|nr:rRNA maturation RNase YbeY [Bacteroidales bacterium]
MILFNTETSFQLKQKKVYKEWIKSSAENEGKKCGDINYIFNDDEQLLKVNQQFLNHDFYTDIITFDYSEGEIISGDIYISIDRVKENANTYNVDFQTELLRVLIHGIMHLCGYKDKSENEAKLMRQKEEFYMKRFVKQIESQK